MKSSRRAYLTLTQALAAFVMGQVSLSWGSGVFSSSGALGDGNLDASIGLNATKTYTHAYNIRGTNVTINGVLFTCVTNFTGVPGSFLMSGWDAQRSGGSTNGAGSGLGALLWDFNHNGTAQTLTLTNLTVGQTYILTFYNKAWGLAGRRIQSVTSSSGAATAFDENVGGEPNANLLRYTFTAARTTEAIRFSGSDTMHLYGFSTELLSITNSWISGSDWTTATWTNGVPNAAGSTANLPAQNAPTSLQLDTPVTVGHLRFDGVNPWTLSGTNTLILATDVGGACVLDTVSGAHTVSAPIALTNDMAKLGDGALTLAGTLSGPQALSVGAGLLALTAANTYSGNTQIQAGTLRLAALRQASAITNQAYYTFDNPENLGQDSSGWGNDATASGSPLYTSSGKFGGAVYLNGSNYFFRSVFPAGVPTGSSPYTIAFWMRPDSSGGANSEGMIGWGTSATRQCNNVRMEGNNQVKHYWWGADLQASASGNLRGDWHFIAATFDGSTRKLYVDGGVIGSDTPGTPSVSTASFYVGRTTLATDGYFKGYLDDVRIVNRALNASELSGIMLNGTTDSVLPSSTEVQMAAEASLDLNGARQTVAALSGAGHVINSASATDAALMVGINNSNAVFAGTIDGDIAVTKAGTGTWTLSNTNTYSGTTLIQGGTMKFLALPSGIQAYYAFDNESSLGQDCSGWGNDIAAIGAPAYTNAGKYGGAVYLNGSSYFVRSVFPAGVPTGSTPYTIALWEKDNGSGNTGGFLGWGNNSSCQCNNLRFVGSNQLMNYWYSSDWTVSGLSTNPKDGNWHHIAVTWDGAVQTMYVDGSPVGTYAHVGLNAQGTNYVVGKTTADVCFKGWLDNVQIANRALTATEINGLMANGRFENMLSTNTSLQIVAGSTLDLNGSSQTVNGLGGGGRLINSSLVNATLTVGGDNSSHEFSGTIDGLLALKKVGTGTLTFSGVNAFSGGTAVEGGTLILKSPSLQAVLSSSLAWFDASDTGSLTTNADEQVTLWANRGTAGTALDAVQINAGVGPTVLTNALNGKPVLSVDGTTALRTKSSVGISYALDRTLFVVGNRKNGGNMFFAHIGDQSDKRAFGIASQWNALFAYTWGTSDDILFSTRANDIYELYDFMIADRYGSANVFSGGTVTSGAMALAPNTTDTQLYLGSRGTNTCFGNLAEIILYNRALSTVERMGVEAYLKTKWFSAESAPTLSAGAVSLAAGTMLDLSGTSQTLSGLSGCGLVTNGTLTVNGTVMPGGTNAIGTLTLAVSNTLSGSLWVDAATDGTCDRLQVQDSLNLNGLSLQIQDTSRLKTDNGM